MKYPVHYCKEGKDKVVVAGGTIADLTCLLNVCLLEFLLSLEADFGLIQLEILR